MKDHLDSEETEDVEAMNEMENNLKLAINELIDESESKSKLVTQHISMIITNLAMAAASLRVQKQQHIAKVNKVTLEMILG
ncbi:MAG: hypothetical protein FK730_16445 [Asgard group archaeon]|nr:hypothetical protein [Asgard group archaeon]